MHIKKYIRNRHRDKHRLIAFKHPLNFNIYHSFMDTLSILVVIIIKFISRKNFALSTSSLKLTLVQHFVNCDSLVIQTGADLLLKENFYFVFEHIEYIICYGNV